jgi:FHA domain
LTIATAMHRSIRTAHRVGYAFCPPLDPDAADVRGAGRHWLVLADRRVALRDGENVVGRDPGVTVWIDAPGVSRRHARITIDGTVVQLEDLDSKNGTTVAGLPIRGSVALRSGDQIAFGAVRAVYRAPEAATSTLIRAGPARLTAERENPTLGERTGRLINSRPVLREVRDYCLSRASAAVSEQVAETQLPDPHEPALRRDAAEACQIDRVAR